MARKVTFDALTLERQGTLTEEQWESMTEDQMIRYLTVGHLQKLSGKELNTLYGIAKFFTQHPIAENKGA